MIALSAVLVLVAAVTLIFGIFGSGLTMIAVSIGSSLLAFGALVLGVVRGRKEPAQISEPFAAARTHEAIPAAPAPVAAGVPLLLDEEEDDESGEDEEETDQEGGLRPLRLDAKPAARKPAARKPAARKPAAKKTTASRAKPAAKSTAKSAKPAAKSAAKSAAKPVARKPAARKPATRKPAARPRAADE